MELYEQLASNEENVRIKAAEELVRKVVQGKKSGETEKGIDSEYALNRLVKGLSSGRESARLGFSIALTEVIHCKGDANSSCCMSWRRLM
jgi:DNA polymerase phi